MTNTPHSNQSQGSGNFFAGLVFGAIAGVAGYFLLQTEEGKSTRKRLNEEWERAKEDLAKAGVIQSPHQTLPEVIQHTIQKIIEPKRVMPTKRAIERTAAQEVFEAEVVNHESTDEIKTSLSSIKKPAKKRAPSTKKFKGV